MEVTFRNVVSALIGAFEPQVHISLVENADPAKCHGNVWVKTNQGLKMHRMVVDNPRYLNRHDDGVTKMLFKQMERLGFEMDHMEIKTQTEHRVYRAGRLSPLMIQSVTQQ